MNKKIFLMFLIVFLTGCNVVYNIDIKDNKVLEYCDFYPTKTIKYQPNSPGVSEYEEMTNYYFNQDYKALKNNYLSDALYDKKMIDNNSRGMNLNYSFTLENFAKSSLLNYCFDENAFKVDDNYIILDAKDSSKCFNQDPYEHLDSFTVKIKTDLNVIDSNADRVNNNLYIWEIARDESLDKDIYIKIKRKSANYSFPFIVLFGIFGIILIIVGLYIFIRKKSIKNNTI